MDEFKVGDVVFDKYIKICGIIVECSIPNTHYCLIDYTPLNRPRCVILNSALIKVESPQHRLALEIKYG
jgi:hypothetical protein